MPDEMPKPPLPPDEEKLLKKYRASKKMAYADGGWTIHDFQPKFITVTEKEKF